MILDNMAVTAGGLALLASAAGHAGSIEITRCAVGDGQGGVAPERMTALAHELGDYPIAGVVVDGNTVTVTVRETQIGGSWYLRELGIFARIGTAEETLFAAATDADPELVSSGSAISQRTYTIAFAFSGDASVIAQLAPTEYATAAAFAAHVNDTTVHVTAAERKAWNAKVSLDENGKIPQSVIPDGVYIPAEQKAAANGVASLDAAARVPVGQMPATAWATQTYSASAVEAAGTLTHAISYARAKVCITSGNMQAYGDYDKASGMLYGVRVQHRGGSGTAAVDYVSVGSIGGTYYATATSQFPSMRFTATTAGIVFHVERAGEAVAVTVTMRQEA